MTEAEVEVSISPIQVHLSVPANLRVSAHRRWDLASLEASRIGAGCLYVFILKDKDLTDILIIFAIVSVIASNAELFMEINSQVITNQLALAHCPKAGLAIT